MPGSRLVIETSIGCDSEMATSRDRMRTRTRVPIASSTRGTRNWPPEKASVDSATSSSCFAIVHSMIEPASKRPIKGATAAVGCDLRQSSAPHDPAGIDDDQMIGQADDFVEGVADVENRHAAVRRAHLRCRTSSSDLRGGSSDDNGSSMSSRAGCASSARPIATRWRSPPER